MKELMIELLKRTPDYIAGNVTYDDLDHRDGITVYSRDNTHGIFHSPSLANMYQAAGFSAYCHFMNGRVELVVYDR